VFVLRCASRLYRRIEPWAAPEREPHSSSTTRLGDWAADIVIVRRKHLVLAVSHVTLLPVLLPNAPATTFLSRFSSAVGQTLRVLGVERHRVASELSAMAECTVTGPSHRRVLDAMTDYVQLLDGYLDERPLVDVALQLAETPCRPLYVTRPCDETVRAFSVPALRLVKT
jgi:hypothetical protein